MSWELGEAYERYIGRWSRQVAPAFVDWLAIPGGQRWLDVGCGTGALAGTVLERAAPSAVTGVEPSDGFRATAAARLEDRATLLAGSATAIPLADASVDVTVSALVLNFVPDPAAGLAEMRRVTRPSGTIAAYVWDYAEGMQMLKAFLEAAAATDPAAVTLDEGGRFPLCHPEPLRVMFAGAGLTEVETTALEVPMVFASLDELWSPFLGGQGPAAAYVISLAEDSRARLREAVRARVPVATDGSIALVARAWAVRGRR